MKISQILSHLNTYKNIISSRYINTPIREVPFLYLNAVDRCNSKCITCPIWKNDSRHQELSVKDYSKIAVSAKKLNTKVISLAGGEPTLRSDLEDIIRVFKDHDFKVHINTNAISLTKKRIKGLADAGLDMIYVSIDSISSDLYQKIRGVNALENVLNSVRYIKDETNLFLGINYVVSSLNFKEIIPFTKKMIELSPDKVQFIPASGNLQQASMSEIETNAFLIKEDTLPAIMEDLKIARKWFLKNNISSNSQIFIEHFDYVVKPKRLIPCFAGHLFVIVDAYGYVKLCYEHGTKLNVKNYPLEHILTTTDYSQARDKVLNCNIPCHDNGSAEPSIRMLPSHILFNFKSILDEIDLYS